MGVLCASFPCANRDRQKAAWFGAARGRSSPESVALVRAGPAPLFPTQLHKNPQKMFLNPPPGDLSDPAVTKAIFLPTAPEPKLYPQDGTSGVQRRVLASLSSLRLGQKLEGIWDLGDINPPCLILGCKEGWRCPPRRVPQSGGAGQAELQPGFCSWGCRIFTAASVLGL